MTSDKSKFLIFHVGNRPYGLELPLVRSIHGANAFVEAQAEETEQDAKSRIPPFLNHTRIQIPNTEFSIPLYDLPVMLGADALLRHSGDQAVPCVSERICEPGTCLQSGRIPGLNQETGMEDHEKVILLNVRDRILALKVDRVDGVMSAESRQIEPLSSLFRGPSLEWFPQVMKKEGHLILVLDPSGIEGMEKQEEEIEAYHAESSASEDIVPGQDEAAFAMTHEIPYEPEHEADAYSRPPESLVAKSGKIAPLPKPEKAPRIPHHETSPRDTNDRGAEMMASDPDSGPKKKIDPGKLETILVRMVHKDNISDMIFQIFTQQLEEIVAREMGRVKKVLLENLSKKGLNNAKK